MLLILVTHSQVYLGNVVAGNLPPPPPILPPVTFPRCATHGIPTTKGNPPPSTMTRSTTPLQPAQEDDISLEEDKLKEQLLCVAPGSSEAAKLMEMLEEMARTISHSKTKTTASLLGMLAKALWKDRQGLFHFDLHQSI